MSQHNYVNAFRFASQSRRNHNFAFSLNPLNGALGAEIRDLDLSGPVNEQIFKQIEEALHDHLVLVFPDQKLSPSRLAEIGRQFGELHLNPFVSGISEEPAVIEIRSEENEEKRFTGLWHSDISWGETPSLGSLLYALEIPPQGGDTLFANMYAAYDALSDGLKTMLDPLRAEHRLDVHKTFDADFADVPTQAVLHPVIRTHPATANKLLFVNEYFTSAFENMTRDESLPLLNYLFQHLSRPDFCCRIRWQPGMMVFWDNRCTQHYATNDYLGFLRRMLRVTIDGDRPV